MYSEAQKKQENAHKKNFLKNAGNDFIKIYEKHCLRSMCSAEVLFNTHQAVKYICHTGVQGDIVELGVYKGGVTAIIAETLLQCSSEKKLWAYDTFEGHPEPSKDEYDVWGNNMHEKYIQEVARHGSWAFASYREVGDFLGSIYSNIVLKKEEVSKASTFDDISSISCLRLDMDWYEPTITALEQLYHKISKKGVIIIDDYGHHSGCRKAVDEFFSNKDMPFFINVNYSCICGIV